MGNGLKINLAAASSAGDVKCIAYFVYVNAKVYYIIIVQPRVALKWCDVLNNTRAVPWGPGCIPCQLYDEGPPVHLFRYAVKI